MYPNKNTKKNYARLPQDVVKIILDLAIQDKKDLIKYSHISRKWRQMVVEIGKTKKKKPTPGQYIRFILEEETKLNARITIYFGKDVCTPSAFAFSSIKQADNFMKPHDPDVDKYDVICNMSYPDASKTLLRGKWHDGKWSSFFGTRYGTWESFATSMDNIINVRDLEHIHIMLEATVNRNRPHTGVYSISHLSKITGTEIIRTLNDPSFQNKFFHH